MRSERGRGIFPWLLLNKVTSNWLKTLPKDLCYFPFKKFLLVCNICTEDFGVAFPYMHIMYPGLVHPSITLFFPLHLLKMASTGFNILYIYLYRKYLNYIHPLHLASPSC
jgi:hypothetical protein